MIRGKPVLAIIPVRAGSKGIPGKNLKTVGRDTLLERTIKLSKACTFVDQTVVSTDDETMFGVAQRHGVSSPSLRPAALATDNALTIDVVLHTLESISFVKGYVLLLQVTTPLRTLADLSEFCSDFESNTDARASVSITSHDAPHPDKIQKIENGFVVSYTGVESMVARQELPPVFKLNGAFYISDTETLCDERTFMPAQTLPYVMPAERSLNLDSQEDLDFLDFMLERGNLTIEEYD